MKNIKLTLLVFLTITTYYSFSQLKANRLDSERSQMTSLHANGMMFTENKGQIVDMEQRLRPDVLFKGDDGGADVYLRKTGISYVLSDLGKVTYQIEERMEDLVKSGKITREQAPAKKRELEEQQTLRLHRIDVDFVNCNSNTTIQTADQAEGYANYYYAHCPRGITHVLSYNEVLQKNIYPNIDIKYYGGKEHGLKYDIVVNPGGNPNQLKLNYSGANELKITDYKLKIKTSVGELGEYIPKVYQNINGQIVDVKAKYVLNGTVVNFEFGTWNHEFPLIIDPWATYFGGSGTENLTPGISTDASGNAIVTGQTASANLPVTAGAYLTTLLSTNNNYFAKLNRATSGRMYVTYLYLHCYMPDIVGDAAGNTYISGDDNNTPSVATFAAAGNVSYQPAFGGASDARLLKFNSAGVLVWDTYYGGSGSETNINIATDGTNVYICGSTSSTTSIATAGAYKLSGTIFVAKFQPNGALLWATYTNAGRGAGGSFHSLACDMASGAIFLFGSSVGVQVEKLSSTGAQLWINDYKGTGAGGQIMRAIGADHAGNAIIVGETSNSSGIGTAGTQQPFMWPINNGQSGYHDVYIIKIAGNGNKLWGTYLGGSQGEIPMAVDADNDNNIYVWGEFEDACADDYPMSSCAYQPACGGNEDCFIARYSPNGMQLCITYLGGAGQDEACEAGGDLVVYQNDLYVCGGTGGAFPVTTGASQTVFGGPATNNPTQMIGGDAFVAKLCINLCESKVMGVDFTASNLVACVNSPLTFTPGVTNTCDTTGYRFLWTFSGGTPATSTARNPSVTFPTNGNHDVKLKVITPCKADSITKSSFINITPCTISAAVTGPNICSGSCATIATNVLSGTPPYTYTWSTGATSPTISACPLTSTFYTATIKDNTGSSTIVTAPVTVSNISLIITSTAVSCILNNGTATATITNGIAPYTYLWSNGQSTQTASGLGPGTYTVTVTDAAGCVKTASVTNSAILLNSSSQNITCTLTGMATVAVIGGTAPFAYNWSNGQVGAQTISATTPGGYTVTVTDGNGCTSTRTFNITGTSPVSASSTGPTSVCLGSPVCFTNTGSTGSTYSWTTTNATVVSGATTNFCTTFLSAGTYSINHLVSNGTCSSTEIKTVKVNNCSATPTVTATANTICPGSCATISSAPAGGTAPYTYSWSTGVTTQNISPCPVSTTTYTVKITDAGGATATTIATVTINPAVNITAVPTDLTCNGSTNGSAIVNSAGGSPPFNYNWSNGQTTQTVTGLSAGNYTVTVTDSKNCTSTTSTVINSPPPLTGVFAKGTNNCSGCGCKEWIMVGATGGTSPYTYTWPDGYSNRYKNSLCPGIYATNIKDKNGCSINVSLTAP